jgi:hypothetical protein
LASTPGSARRLISISLFLRGRPPTEAASFISSRATGGPFPAFYDEGSGPDPALLFVNFSGGNSGGIILSGTVFICPDRFCGAFGTVYASDLTGTFTLQIAAVPLHLIVGCAAFCFIAYRRRKAAFA